MALTNRKDLLVVLVLFSVSNIILGQSRRTKFDRCGLTFTVPGINCEGSPKLLKVLQRAVDNQSDVDKKNTKLKTSVAELQKFIENFRETVNTVKAEVGGLKRVAFYPAPNPLIYGADDTTAEDRTLAPPDTTDIVISEEAGEKGLEPVLIRRPGRRPGPDV
ncbi:uncharacterized protein LOC106151349 [Lingula anatina]|uniref:Uncharacterized protein LOC106151349 n=1 Tax=Lingula anatina TaxID=7574 RepID=A0A1S3H1M0_LINAN|nr:uncharacterized protein LOC106151349 [Lingula anatina]|eukprot:XP_013380025.1 uncharacterized protein LOC106151349 [Lingula anatina]